MIFLMNHLMHLAFSYYDTIFFPIGMILIPCLILLSVLIAKIKGGKSFPTPKWEASFLLTMILSTIALMICFFCRDMETSACVIKTGLKESDEFMGFILLSLFFHGVAWIYLISYLLYWIRQQREPW